MDCESVKKYFGNPKVVADYVSAAEKVGLWKSEKIVIEKYVGKNSQILELGCGAGRISFGLSVLGYKNITATDFSPDMVTAAEGLFRKYGLPVKTEVVDACTIPYSDNSYDAAIFGFNGLMQIPNRERRKTAVREIFRILKTNGVFVFTTHDRNNPANKTYWDNEIKQWNSHSQNPVLDDFGDIVYRGDYGNIFIHSPDTNEILSDLSAASFKFEYRAKRSEISEESENVLNFSDDCYFYVFSK